MSVDLEWPLSPLFSSKEVEGEKECRGRGVSGGDGGEEGVWLRGGERDCTCRPNGLFLFYLLSLGLRKKSGSFGWWGLLGGWLVVIFITPMHLKSKHSIK